MKKKYILMGITGVFVVSTMIGGTLAAIDTSTTEGATAGISVKNIDVGLESGTKMKTVDGEIAIETAAVPGGSYESTYRICNADANGYDMYVKVEIYKYWEDDSEVLESKYDSIYFDLDGEPVTYPQELEEGYITENGWLVQYADDEQIVLYYTKPLLASGDAKENTTTAFMDGVSFDAEIGNAYADKCLKLEYVVTAVQAGNGEAAMAAEWGMFPAFDENGNIVGVYETEEEAIAARTQE